MAYIKKLFNKNFLEYASYVIKDRAIPHIDDGMKPVQRRILHSLMEMDDGKFHKVANVVGHCMRYHPHGDASIGSALVVLANKELFIDKQGNFGNPLTGDEASAPRYIECRLRPLAKDILYNPEITPYEDSYDGRSREPVTFPAKLPLVLIQGIEGIAVGMSTRVLPHNFREVVQAVRGALTGEQIPLYPDFPSKGLVDVSGYDEGRGKVLVRARMDTSDPKKIVIREIPYGTTTESLIASIEGAAKAGKIKIASINDYTAEEVEIEIKLPRGVYTQDLVDALHAFTDCEYSISVNLLLIKDNKPTLMSIPEVIDYHAGRLIQILKAELQLEKKNLEERLHARTLERIFIEERIYKRIEEMPTRSKVHAAVREGFEPFKKEIRREITEEDIERLLKIPIRRISRYDIEKARREVEEIQGRLKEIAHHLKHLTEYAVSFLDGVLEKNKEHPLMERRTEITSFSKVDIREAAVRDRKLYYSKKSGYLGTEVSGGKDILEVSEYDRILIFQKKGIYRVIPVPEKLYVGKDLVHCLHTDQETLDDTVFSVLYRTADNLAYIKRFQVQQYILEREYEFVPEGGKFMKMTTWKTGFVHVEYKPRPRMQVTEQNFPLEDYRIKGVKAQGVRVNPKEIKTARFMKTPPKDSSPRQLEF